LIRTSPSHRIRVRRTIGRIVRTGIAVVVVLTAAGCSDDRRPQIGAPSTSSSALTASVATTATTEPTETTATAKVVADPAALTDRLQSVVDGFTVAQPVPFSVVVVDLSTGAQAAQLGDRSVLSASLYKLFVARELIRRVEAGEVHGDAPAGDTMNRTIDQCIEAMIVVSDNACGVAGLRLVGGGGLDGRLHRDGFVSTSLASPQRTSAADVVLFLERARDGTLLGRGGEAGSAALYSLLKRQQVNDRLPVGLPAGTPIAHKTGDRLHWAHDAGVMTTARGDVVVAALSGPWDAPCCDADHPGPSEVAAFGAIAELGRQVYAATS
jgi:beta-lactamase class A